MRACGRCGSFACAECLVLLPDGSQVCKKCESLVRGGVLPWDQRAELWGRMQQHFHTPELALKTIEDHDAIVGAIASRDADGARAAMHRHMARVAREFQRGVDGGRRVTTPRKPARPRAAAKPRQARARP